MMTEAMTPVRQHRRRPLAMAVAGCLLAAAPALAQLNGQNVEGDMGLKSGSQAPRGVCFAVPLYFLGTILLTPIHLP
jgi:hypothetical protein